MHHYQVINERESAGNENPRALADTETTKTV
jgi:hypothetical protein